MADGSSNCSFSAPFGGWYSCPGIYTNVSFPTPMSTPSTSFSLLPNIPVKFTTKPLKEEEPVEPMHVLEPQIPAQLQLELEKMAILQEIWKQINTPVYFSELSGKVQFLPTEKVDFSDMPKLTRMDC